jgi:hypothetical protein
MPNILSKNITVKDKTTSAKNNTSAIALFLMDWKVSAKNVLIPVPASRKCSICG